MKQQSFRWLAGSASVLALAGMLGSLTLAEAPAVKDQVQFNRDVRPVLSENCFSCHGPDSANRKAGLRLDRKEDLFADRDGVLAVVPGKPAESALIERIFSDKPAKLMPPAKSHKKLTPAQKDLLRKWIEQGAPWEPHWSLIVPKRPQPPEAAHAAVRNAIDRFIFARLKEQGLEPAAEADKNTLVRRVTLDLTGLPPTPEEVERFVKDAAPDAYEKLVDRLLASKHYGEHRARTWLDAARYADTHGLHFDNYREMWPYRDWVIDAFNKNMPFDRFTIEQLAGDLLPNRTLEQQIATGFHRCNITTNEGGVIQEEVEAMYAKDRVETTGTVWLGLTIGCATCHDHKFDPIAQKDFYQFVAYFRNSTVRTMDGNVHDSPPIITVPRVEERDRWFALQKEIAGVQGQRDARLKEAQKPLDDWLTSGEAKKLTEPLDPKDVHLTLALEENADRLLSGKLQGEDLGLDLGDGLTYGAGPAAPKALYFGPQASVAIADAGDFEADQPFAVATWVFQPANENGFTVLGKTETKEKHTRGWRLEIGSRAPIFSLLGDSAADNVVVSAAVANRLAPGKWHHLLVNYDGSRKAAGITLFVNGKALPRNRPGDPVIKGSIRNGGTFHLGGDGARDFNGGALQGLRVYRKALRAEEAAVLASWDHAQRLLNKDPKALTPPERQELLMLYVQRKDERYTQIIAELAKLEQEQTSIRQRSAVTHVMEERPNSIPKTRVLFRGQYDQPREEVIAATPGALHAFPQGGPNNRLGLANWLMDANNPLTARVTVNRYWQEVFGTGLVRTSEDFGIMGENPSHPELLDWLAVEFRESGWDIKKFMKLMVMSGTYRQSAAATPEKLKKDPNNRLLSRGPRFRLDGETLRDTMLATSGLLARDKIGGPSVRPYQPTGIWEAVAMHGSNTRFYVPDKGDGLYRRSMYTFWKRAAPPASMDIFNAPSREGCSVRRERTNTPLQALVTLNDPQFVEAARVLAQRTLLDHADDFDKRLDYLTLSLVARAFEKRERDICRSALDDFRALYKDKPQEAQKLIQTGESKPDPKLTAAELAAWTMLVNQLMNLDEALNK